MKRSLTANEETATLPRRDEFAAAARAADAVGADIVGADLEMDGLVRGLVRALSLPDWVSLAVAPTAERFGLAPSDPVRRRPGETLPAWEERRRDPATARASREHGERTLPGLSRALVDDRDELFADRCKEARTRGRAPVVCVIGSVHMDGVTRRLSDSTTTT